MLINPEEIDELKPEANSRSLNETVITPDCALAFTSADKLPTHFDAETQRIRLHIGLDQGFVTDV